jgi:hypothetical protein
MLEEYKEKFDIVRAKALLTSGKEPSPETSKFSLYFSVSCIPINLKAFLLLPLPQWQRPFQE